jgi:hypothetical protein
MRRIRADWRDHSMWSGINIPLHQGKPMDDAELSRLLALACDALTDAHAMDAPWSEDTVAPLRTLAQTLHRKLLENRLCNMFMRDFPNATVHGHHGIEGLLVQAERQLARHLRAGRCSQAEFAEGVRLCVQLREAGCVPSREVEEEIDRLMRPASEDPEHQEWLRRTFTLGDHRLRPRSVTIGPAVLPEDTTITLIDARYVMIGDVIDFDGEIMEVTAAPDLATGTVTVARGLRGTVAAGHAPYTVGFLIGNTRTGGEVIYPPPPTVLSGPERRRMRDAAERSRRVREDLDITPDPSLCLNCHRRAVAEGAHLCAECSAHYIAYPEMDGLTVRSRPPAADACIDAETAEERARAEDITPPHLSRFARSVRAVIGTLGRVPALAEARRWVAVDLRDGALTSESAAERLRLLDELEGRAEGA